MADTAVAISAGSGTNIDTRTEATNGNHRQVVVIGDPSTNAGVAPVDAVKGVAVDLTASGALPAGTNAIGKLAANSGVDIGDVDLGTVASVYHAVAASSDNTANVKTSAGTLHAVDVFNNAAYPVYIKFHNTAGTPTSGAGVVLTIGVQAGTGRQVVMPQGGRAFATGIGISMVKGLADNSTTALVAADCVVDVIYA